MKPVSFSAADKKYKLTRFGEFDAEFEKAYVHEGDLVLGKNATGEDVVKAFGYSEDDDEPGLFVVTGNLVVPDVLDLDEGISFSMGLLVVGQLKAKVVKLDMTMLFVFGGAVVSDAIFFETNDGTLSIAKDTTCPLIICHDGDLNVKATGEVFCSSDEGPLDDDGDDEEGDDEDESDQDEWPFAETTMTLAEAKKALVAEVWDGDEFNSEAAFGRAVKGQPILKAAGKKK